MSSAAQSSRLGDFELLAKLGEGGMGAVYKARQVALDRIVAVKVLPRRMAGNGEYIARFLREARATAKLNHPHIVVGIGVGCIDGYYYFAMEYVEGVTLKARIVAEGCLPEDEVLRIGAAVAAALSHAHAAGIVHRDVKPDNVLLGQDGLIKLSDLGLAKAGQTEDGSLTVAGCVVGTPHYMAPEQARGETDLDGRADTYALGCSLYHAATGRTPFNSTMPAVLMVKHINEKIPHPQSVRPDLSDQFCAVLERMLARQPDDRYPDLQEAAQDMESVRNRQPLLYGPLPLLKVNFDPASVHLTSTQSPRPSGHMAAVRGHGRAAPSPPTREGSAPRTRSRGERRSTPWAPVGAIIALLALAGVVYLCTRDAGDKRTVEAAEKTTPAPRPMVPVEAPKPSPAIEPSMPPPPVVQVPKPPPAVVDPPRLQVPVTSASAPWVPFFNGQDINTWRVLAPKWHVENGGLAGIGEVGNAALVKDKSLPQDFELTLTVTSSSAYHFGWSGPDNGGSNFVQRDPGGRLRLVRYRADDTINLDTADGKAPDGTHTYRVVLRGSVLVIFVDGAQTLATTQATPAQPGRRRDLFVYASHSAQTIYRDVNYRDLPP